MAQREFLVRTVTYLAAQAGIRQFLDVGTGLPTANNTHEVAQSVAPESRIVYVDYDPLVLAVAATADHQSASAVDPHARQPSGGTAQPNRISSGRRCVTAVS